MSASGVLARARERCAAGRPAVSADRIVGLVGAGIPVELVLAAGLVPVAISGASRPTPRADAYGLGDLDGPARGALEVLLEPDGWCAFALLGSERAVHADLYATLREIERVEPVVGLARVAFVDLRHLEGATSADYNRGQLARVAGILSCWSGTDEIDDQRLRAAAAQVNALRARLQAVASLRHAVPARLSGSDALALIGAALVSPLHETMTWLDELLTGADALTPAPAGTRVYLTGSTPQDLSLYDVLEEDGLMIVGEDHPRGQDAFGPPIDAGADPLTALARHCQAANLSARRSSVQRARHAVTGAQAAHAEMIVSYTAAYDDATPWDVPALREAADAAGIRHALLAQDEILTPARST